MKTLADLSASLRKADALELPDLRCSYIDPHVANWGGEKPPCCAIGGANVADGNVEMQFVGKEPVLSANSVIAAQEWRWPNLVTWCPACTVTGSELENLVAHLYDSHEWSRSQIADWIDTLVVEE